MHQRVMNSLQLIVAWRDSFSVSIQLQRFCKLLYLLKLDISLSIRSPVVRIILVLQSTIASLCKLV